MTLAICDSRIMIVNLVRADQYQKISKLKGFYSYQKLSDLEKVPDIRIGRTATNGNEIQIIFHSIFHWQPRQRTKTDIKSTKRNCSSHKEKTSQFVFHRFISFVGLLGQQESFEISKSPWW